MNRDVELLLIPGLLGDGTFWHPMLAAFKNSHHSQVINISQCNAISEMAQLLVKNVKSKVILIGFSLGAWVALNACRLLGLQCQGLILISSAPGNLTASVRQRFSQYIDLIYSGRLEEFILNDYEQDVSQSNKKNNHLKKLLINMMKAQGSEVAIRQLKAMLEFNGNFSNLSYVSCPTLLIRGADDKSINIQRQEQMLAEIPNSKLAIVPNAAHYVPLENPDMMVFEILDWMKQF